MWLIMATGVAAAVCENTISLDDVEQRLDGIEISIIKMDFERINRTQSALLKDISCLNELLPTELAVRFHQVVGVAYHINDDITKAQQSFATAKLLSNEPLSAQLFPEGHSIYELYENSPTATRVAVSLPPNNKLFFDGKETTQRPAGGPTLCQQSTEATFRSSYLFPDSSVPFEWFQVAPLTIAPVAASTAAAPEASTTTEKFSFLRKRNPCHLTLPCSQQGQQLAPLELLVWWVLGRPTSSMSNGEKIRNQSPQGLTLTAPSSRIRRSALLDQWVWDWA